MRLHIVPDEKIINRTIANFNSVFPNDNKFIVLTSTPHSPKYVNKFEGVHFAKYDTPVFWEFVGDVDLYSTVVIHYLRCDSADFIRRINHPNIYWIEWGVDLYGHLLAPKGYELYYDSSVVWKTRDTLLPKFIFNFLYKMNSCIRRDKYLKAVRKVRYFVPDSMYDEYPLLLSYYPELSSLEYKEFFYYPIDEILGGLSESTCTGDSIIVGNSASLTGNHTLIFNKLKELDLKNRKVVVPLSYGNRNYSKLVIEDGGNLLKDNFHPIQNYMPLQDYNKLLLSANNYIYGNWRQEAVGNILVALYLGGKVYLEEKNPLLPFYKKMGLVIFSTKELTQEMIDTKLTEDEVNNNRHILKKRYSREKQLQIIKNNF